MGNIMNTVRKIEKLNIEVFKHAQVIGEKLNFIIDKFGERMGIMRVDQPIDIRAGQIMFIYEKYDGPLDPPIKLAIWIRLPDGVNGTLKSKNLFDPHSQDPLLYLLESLTVQELDLPEESLELLVYNKLRYHLR